MNVIKEDFYVLSKVGSVDQMAIDIYHCKKLYREQCIMKGNISPQLNWPTTGFCFI